MDTLDEKLSQFTSQKVDTLGDEVAQDIHQVENNCRIIMESLN